MMNTSFAVAALAAVGLSLEQPALGQSNDKLGIVNFETSCKPEAQELFNQGMLYQHSFWYRASQKVFEDALKADPECGIAYWGTALSLLWNPHATPPAKNLTEGASVIAKGKTVGAKTQRERDYIDALGTMYADYDKVDHRTSLLAYANQLKAAAILEPISERQPQHPGVSHYLIHLYDYPPIAEKGLNAARRYAKIAPAAAHAQHMPSHIFTRVGYWTESIASNTEAARVAKDAGDLADQLHAMDYQVYANLQLGQDAKAKALIDEMTGVTVLSETYLPGPYALAASPARFVIERGDWKAASELQVRPSPLAQVQALTHFARALGAARIGKPEVAQADIVK